MFALEPGVLVAGRYLVEAVVRGGMGAVCRAVDQHDGTTVGLKLLPPGAGEPLRERFERETRLLAALRHPGIVGYLDHCTDPALGPVLVMEWLDGEDLASRLARAGVSAAEAVEITRQLLDALELLHARGVIHRDLKPSNVFLVSGAQLQVKLIDFGVARTQLSSVTQTGVTLGTPSYMAPEQARGAREIDGRADLFALGCVMFEMLAGHPPFRAESVWACLAKILFAPAPRLAELRPDLDSGLLALVDGLLAKAPDERPREVAMVRAALASVSVEASAPTPSQAPAPALSGTERRLLAVLVARLPQDHARAPIAGPAEIRVEVETIGDTLHDEHATFALVREYAGALERLPDGTRVAVFGARGAATDLALQAARCALVLRRRWPGSSMALVMGLESSAQLPIAELIDRAAGLMRARPRAAGTVALDRVTAALLEARFELHDEDGPLLGSERDEGAIVKNLLGRPSPFVGRRTELRELLSIFKRSVRSRRASTVLITAAAGVGKSRLRVEFVRELRARGELVEIWSAAGDIVAAGAPLGMLAGLLRAAAGIRVGDPSATQRAQLEAMLAARDALDEPARARMFEFFAELLGIASAEPSAQLLRARRDQLMMAEELRVAWEELVRASYEARPLLLILEDLHWGDPATLSFIDAISRRAEGPLIVLALARPELIERFGRLWERCKPTRMALDTLDADACSELARRVLDTGADTIARIVDLAAGNAFFLEELIRASARGEQLPATVLAMVHARIERLRADVRRVLRAASVFGERFWIGGVAELLGEDFSTDALAESVEVLVDEELIERSRSSRFPDEREYLFRHALVREAAYESLTADDRELGHRLAGTWLEHGRERSDLVLAGHFERGRDRARAFVYLGRAADRAFEAADPVSALALSERAIACAETELQIGQLRGLQAETYIWMGRMSDALRCDEQALASLPARSAAWYRALGHDIWSASVSGDVPRSFAACVRLTSEAPPQVALDGFARACGWAMRALCLGGRFEEVAALDARAGEFVDPERLDDNVSIWLDWGRTMKILWGESDPWAALQLWASVRDRAFELEQRRTGVMIAIELAMPLSMMGAHQRIVDELPPHIAFMDRTGNHFIAAWGEYHLADALTRLDRHDQAEALLARNIEFWRRFIPMCTAYPMLTQARAALRRGQPERAEAIARRALHSPLPLRHVVEFRSTLARALIARGQLDEAERLATKAHAAVTRGHAGYFRASAALTLHRVHEARARPEAAAAALQGAREHLQRVAARIDDPALRRSYLDGVADHRALAQLG